MLFYRYYVCMYVDFKPGDTNSWQDFFYINNFSTHLSRGPLFLSFANALPTLPTYLSRRCLDVLAVLAVLAVLGVAFNWQK